MKHLLAAIFGILAAALNSLALAAAASFAAGYVSHMLEPWPSLFLVSVVPCGLSGLGLSLLSTQTRKSRWRLHLSSVLAGFFTVALSGSLGAVVVQSMQHGLERVNVIGYFTWC